MVKVHCFAEKLEYIGVCPNSYQTLVSQIGTYEILVEDILRNYFMFFSCSNLLNCAFIDLAVEQRFLNSD